MTGFGILADFKNFYGAGSFREEAVYAGEQFRHKGNWKVYKNRAY